MRVHTSQGWRSSSVRVISCVVSFMVLNYLMTCEQNCDVCSLALGKGYIKTCSWFMLERIYCAKMIIALDTKQVENLDRITSLSASLQSD